MTQKNLQIGTGLTLDVLVAQDAAYQARLHHATAIVHYNQAEVNLLAALGLIDELSVEAEIDGGWGAGPVEDRPSLTGLVYFRCWPVCMDRPRVASRK